MTTVDYIKNSNYGLASAGESIMITTSNANNISKDVSFGNVDDLNGTQQTCLDNMIDEDTLEYSDDEMKMSGEQQIDTEGTEEGQAKGTSIAATSISSIAAAFGATALIIAAADGFSALAFSITMAAAGASSVGLAAGFDPAKQERIAKTEQSEGDIETINAYYDTLTNDADLMMQQSEEYIGLSDYSTEMQTNSILEIGALQSELITYQAQGNAQKVAEIQQQIADLQGEAEEGTGVEEDMEGIKENIETYSGNNAEAQGVKESGNTVKGFLEEGKELKALAITNAVLLAGAGTCALLCTPIPKMPFFIDGPAAVAAKILTCVAAASLLTAAGLMSSTADKEAAAADASEAMASPLDSLQSNIDSHEEMFGTTEALYVETDAASVEETSNIQEQTSDANEKQIEKTGTTTPTIASEPEPEPEPTITT